MKPNFSFKYNGNLIKSSEFNSTDISCGIVYDIDKDVTVTAKVNDIAEFIWIDTYKNALANYRQST